MMPADAPQARIAAQILIVREAMDDTFARGGAPGLPVEQICRLRRTGSALTNSVAALERMLWRHQQRPVPFFGTVLADEVDVVALAAAWGASGAGAGPVRDAGASGQERAAPARKRAAGINPLPLSAPPGRAAGRPPAWPGGDATWDTSRAVPCAIATPAFDTGNRRDSGGRGDCDH